MSRDLPARVRATTDRFLALVDEALPGSVQGLYLHGSLGFGEWYDGCSDVDFVAVHAERPDAVAVAALREVHARMDARPPFDGFHVTWDDLARSALRCPDVPGTLGGTFQDEGRVDVHPVTWHELAGHGVTVRGPEAGSVEIWTDEQELREYTHGNLHSYWGEQAQALRDFPVEAARPDIVAWCVLGTSRLHHLLARNTLTSKSGAGRYALEAFDERWHPLVTEALAIRETGEPSGLYDGREEQRGRDNADFAAVVVSSGLDLPV